MPIFDQGYQHWEGKLTGHAWRWWAIAKRGAWASVSSKWIRAVMIMSLSPALALAGFLVIWGLIEQGSSWVTPLLSLIPYEELRAGPRAYRVMVWTFAFHAFFLIEVTLAMLVVVLVGPDLISKDLRFNALPLYLSRPLRRIDYFAGKLGVIGIVLAAVMITPPIVAYALGLAFGLDLSIIRDTWHLPLAAIGLGLVFVFSAGTLMLAISALSRNSRYVAAMWVAFWILTNSTSAILANIFPDHTWPAIVSYTRNLTRLGEQMFSTERAWTQVDQLRELAKKAADQAPRIPGMRFAHQPPRRDPRQTEELEPGKPWEVQAGFRSLYPWQWSAGVLIGIWGLSACVLMFRVRSLDRLK